MTADTSDADEAKAAAQDVFLTVAGESDLITEYPTVLRAMDDTSLRDVVTIAWRHQFDPDRSSFKREIRELEEHVAKRMAQLMETES